MSIAVATNVSAAKLVGEPLQASILLVDDHPANLLALEAILEPLGHRLVRSNSGRQALERALEDDFAVILLDVNMPGLDGFQTAESLREQSRTRTTPIIFLSAAERDPEELRKGYRYGAVDFLVKPLVPEILRSKVAVFVELFLQSEQLKQRKVAEARLRDTQARLTLALEAGRLGTWEWSMVTNRVSWSPMLESIHGIPVGSFDGTYETYQSYLHPEDRDQVLATIARTVETRSDHHLEHRIVRPDGEVRWIEASGQLVVDATGRPVRLLGVCHDVTDRRQSEAAARRLAAEEAARKSAEAAKEELRQILDSVTDPFVILDPQWGISYINRDAATLIGIPAEELRGQNLWEKFPAAVGSVYYQNYHRARNEGVAVLFEEYIPELKRWFEVQAVPTSDGRLAVYSRDVTARKNVELIRAQDARHSALRADVSTALGRSGDLRQLLQGSCEAMVNQLHVAFARVWTVSTDGKMLELQASAGLYTHIDGPHARVPVGKFKIGLIAEEQRPHHTNDVAHDPRVGDRAWAAAQNLIAFAGYPLMVEGRCVGVVAMFAQEKISDSTLSAVSTIADAIAQGIQRKRAEEALEDRARELARSNAELERFAYIASHDLQEPLRMVGSYTQLLGRRYAGKLDKDADEFISFAVDGVTRMQTLINDLLSFSRVGTKGGQMTPVRLEASLTAALANLGASIKETQAQITHDPLPTVMASQGQMVQLFQNLIGNAIKFHSGDAPRVHIGVEPVGDDWQLSVRDNGIGIDPEFFNRLFVVFQRLHNRSEYPGNGIGLAICKKIVERHDGRIWIESALGQGTTFFFTLRGATT